MIKIDICLFCLYTPQTKTTNDCHINLIFKIERERKNSKSDLYFELKIIIRHGKKIRIFHYYVVWLCQASSGISCQCHTRMTAYDCCLEIVKWHIQTAPHISTTTISHSGRPTHRRTDRQTVRASKKNIWGKNNSKTLTISAATHGINSKL